MILYLEHTCRNSWDSPGNWSLVFAVPETIKIVPEIIHVAYCASSQNECWC